LEFNRRVTRVAIGRFRNQVLNNNPSDQSSNPREQQNQVMNNALNQVQQTRQTQDERLGLVQTNQPIMQENNDVIHGNTSSANLASVETIVSETAYTEHPTPVTNESGNEIQPPRPIHP